ncbi:MAG: malate synthase G, partial [Rhodospirillales bacterium]|nr:malate synthase G [Rhodospirillales bacterium]
MTERVKTNDLHVATVLFNFIKDEVLPGTGLSADQFWGAFSAIIHDLGPRSRQLLEKRDLLQRQIDDWHLHNRAKPFDASAYQRFLQEIGYLHAEGPDFTIGTQNVDAEIATLAGPQLVVPVMNARYALNAANARWGSLYDALYGTDVIAEDAGREKGAGYNPKRGQAVFAYAASVLDQATPLEIGGHADVVNYGLSTTNTHTALTLTLKDGRTTNLRDPSQFTGFITDDAGAAQVILLKNHGLHLELHIDRDHRIGLDHPAGIKDVVVEAALTTIQDCEDSIAAVDADDKVVVYRNWLGLMKGNLTDTFEKNGKTIVRRLMTDRVYTRPDGDELTVHGRSLLMVRNVGH